MRLHFDYLIGTVLAASADRAHRDYRKPTRKQAKDLIRGVEDFLTMPRHGKPRPFVGAKGCGKLRPLWSIVERELAWKWTSPAIAFF